MSRISRIARRIIRATAPQTGVTLKETRHGNPGERRVLPAGTLVELQPASNLPTDSPIKWWAHPVEGHPWPEDTARWAEDVGVGLYADDVEIQRDELEEQWAMPPYVREARRIAAQGEAQATLEEIARKHLGIETLATRKSDSLDFHEVAVWSLKDALEAAFRAGRTTGPPAED